MGRETRDTYGVLLGSLSLGKRHHMRRRAAQRHPRSQRQRVCMCVKMSTSTFVGQAEMSTLERAYRTCGQVPGTQFVVEL